MDFERPGFGTVCSAWKHAVNTKDCTGYTATGGGGVISGYNDSGVPFTYTTDAEIVYMPGYFSGSSYYFGEGVYNKYGAQVVSGPVTLYDGTVHTGYLQIGRLMLDGDYGKDPEGKRHFNFSAGSGASVTAITETRRFLVKSTTTGTSYQNFAFDMGDDWEGENEWEL